MRLEDLPKPIFFLVFSNFYFLLLSVRASLDDLINSDMISPGANLIQVEDIPFCAILDLDAVLLQIGFQKIEFIS